MEINVLMNNLATAKKTVSDFEFSSELSTQIAANHSNQIKKNACYDNVFYMATNGIFEDVDKLQILFCYMPSSQKGVKWHIRHAMCVYEGRIIEPLQHINLSTELISEIAPFALFSFSEYIDAVLKEESTGLLHVLLEREVALFNSAPDIVLNPFDLCTLVELTDSGDFTKAFSRASEEHFVKMPFKNRS